MMKKILIPLLFIATVTCADSWEEVHTFPDNAYKQIIFNNGKYFVYEGINSEAKTSTNLLDWTSHLQSIDSSLFEWDVSWINICVVGNSNLICLMRDSRPDPDGIFISTDPKHRWISLTSSDGYNWGNPKIICSNYMVAPYDIKTTVMNNELYLLAAAQDDFFTSPLGKRHIYRYNSLQNSWSSIWSQDRTPVNGTPLGGSFFSDGANLYISEGWSTLQFPSTNTMEVGLTICLQGGTAPNPIDDVYTGEAVAWNGTIFSTRGWGYSDGASWQYHSNNVSGVSHLMFNGNRMAGNLSDKLAYSDDFGETWHETYVGEISSASIIEADQKYIALISTPTNSSMYTLDAYPSRATVTEIQGFGITPVGLNFQSTSNGLYQLECSDTLINPNWKSYGLPKAGTGEGITIDPSESLTSNIFFRVRAINN